MNNYIHAQFRVLFCTTFPISSCEQDDEPNVTENDPMTEAASSIPNQSIAETIAVDNTDNRDSDKNSDDANVSLQIASQDIQTSCGYTGSSGREISHLLL